MILIVPACERGQGGGHLSRSLLLLRSLRLTNRDAYLWIPDNLKADFLQRFGDFFKSFDRPCILSNTKELDLYTWDFILLDNFRSSKKHFAFWSGIAPIIGIDEGGPSRGSFDFLIDLLPPLSKHEPNLSVTSLLPLPRNRRPLWDDNSPALRVLISFGIEDSAGLGEAAARALDRIAAKSAGKDGVRSLDITLIAPIPPVQSFAAIKVIGKIPMLQEHLAGYDLLITHFGLSAFEAVYARLPVLLISPTAYHERLSRKAGFYSLGFGALKARRLEKITFEGEFLDALAKRGKEIAARYDLEEDQKKDLGFFVHSLDIRVKRYCPVCGKKPKSSAPVLARSGEESYRRCRYCAVIYLNRLNAPPVEYERDYFFDFYKKQYGKTYLEDFPNLKEMGRKRLAVIKTIIDFKTPSLAPKLLDIGCAYGPFLAAAAEEGFSPVGIDAAEDAVRYVKDELGFPACHGLFHASSDGEPNALAYNTLSDNEPFDVISLWYVIEHFEEPGKALIKINRLLKTGGVLAFSTPSFSGISGRKNLRSFLKKSPPDHFTVWSPGSCKKILEQYGFSLKKIVVTGHHPERFPFFGRFLNTAKKCWLYRLLMLVSRTLELGDTFEVYAVKNN